MNQQFNFIIVDESHYLKNRKAVTTKYLVPLLQQAKHKLLLTGTPALARPVEVCIKIVYCLKSLFIQKKAIYSNAL